jgi:hypothetical protein
VILWRAGLRIQEALALAEGDLDQRRGALLALVAFGRLRSRAAWTAKSTAGLHPPAES